MRAFWSTALGAFMLAAPYATTPSINTTSPAATADTGAAAKGKPNPGPTRRVEFDTDEGTWMSVDISPDGRTLIFDLLGDIYTLPIEGGDAKLLLGGRDWDQMPKFSKDGKRIAFVSDRDGNMNLWIANVDGTGLKQMGKSYKEEAISPFWSPDGLVMVWQNGSGYGSGGLWAYYVDGGSGFMLPGTSSLQSPALSPDGRFLYGGGAYSGMRRIDRVAGDTVSIGPGMRPQVSPDGRWLAYARSNDSKTALHLRDLRTGMDRRLVSEITHVAEGFTNQDVLPGYAFSPDSRSIVMSIKGKLNRVDVATGAVSNIPFKAHIVQDVVEPIRITHRMPDGDVKLRVIRWPTLAPNASEIVFGAVGKVWKASLSGSSVGAAERMTSNTDREYTPAYSPDGRWVAYTTWNDTTFGHVMVLPAGSRDAKPRQVTTVAGRYANVAWSRDGKKLAFLRGGGAELRGAQPETETYFDIMWVPVEGGEPQQVTTTVSSRAAGFPMRYYPVISFNPDGSRIFFSQWGSRGGGVPKATLYSVRLDGTDRRGVLSTTALDEIVPAPDGKHVAFVRREQVFISALPGFSTTPIDIGLDGGSVPVKQLTKTGGNYVAWLNDSTVSWVMTNRLYTQSLKDTSATLRGEINVTLPRTTPKGTIAFTNARIITMKGDQVIQRGTIVATDGRIAAVGPSGSVKIPSGATVVNASGKTIMPGLVDVHAHMHYQGFEVFPQTKWEYVANLAYGVTTTYDPSAHNLDVFAQQEMVETGEMLGPRIYSSGDVIYGEESVFPVVYENIRSIDDARNVVKRFKNYSPTLLKQYMQPRRDQRQWVIQAAREEGIMVTAEGGGDLVMDMTMVLDGYTAWEHALPTAPLYKDVVELVARSKVHYTPTLIVAYGGASMEPYFSRLGKIHDDAKLRRFTPEDNLDRFRSSQIIPEEEEHWIDVSKAAAAISKAGGNVSLGAHGNRQGLGAQWEMWGLKMGGLSNLEAIRNSTLVPAQKLAFDRDVGSLEVGKFADFLVLDANPLDDIQNSRKLRYTVKNGFVYDAESMTRVWPSKQKLPRIFWQSADDLRKFAPPEPKELR
jgi:imidazolonepropionase-like amidohydrolase/Tol biopolymer transport system component